MTQNDDGPPETNQNINTEFVSSNNKYRITMELPLFFTMMALSLSGAVTRNIILYRTCVHSLNHSKNECEGFLSPTKANITQHLEEEVQKYEAFVSMVRITFESLAPAILSLFLGVWSDTHGRKPLVAWPLFGMCISGALTVIYSMMDFMGPWWYILTVIPTSFLGGFTSLFTGSFCYVSDITSIEKRSFRMTLVETAVSIGSVIGAISSSYVLRAVGIVYLLLIATTLYVFAYVFTIVFLKESLQGAVEGNLLSVLDFSLIKEMGKKCFKKRPNHGRAQILLLTFANSFSIFIMMGLMNLEYNYTRTKLHWAIKEYTTFSAVNTTITFLGSLIGVILIQKLLRISDLLFSMLAFLSSTVEYIIKMFAVTTWFMYLGAGVSMFKGLSSPLIRSMLTKMLPPDDIAKVFALMCAIEGVAPLVSPAIFSSLYAYTINSFPGAIYLLSSSITALCVVLLGIVQYFIWKGGSQGSFQQLEEEE
ncbi:PREDICTED: proton-coupled folate transporter-like [Papilio xuthus]|uniref:Proton-coupled folate transporter-like n=1 Tax=Papilio xuthus TaxID=66420 RepID=A0AAJ6Z132_PAPXU|nr:PREDICTED: proton-coupled folate transporter-like [Papilio xuthus]